MRSAVIASRKTGTMTKAWTRSPPSAGSWACHGQRCPLPSAARRILAILHSAPGAPTFWLAPAKARPIIPRPLIFRTGSFRRPFAFCGRWRRRIEPPGKQTQKSRSYGSACRKKPAELQAFSYGMFFHGHVPGKNTVTRQIFAKIWRNRPAGRSQTVEKNPAKRFFDSLCRRSPLRDRRFCILPEFYGAKKQEI